jgi:mannose-6-phosphate isomerase class I
MRKGAAVPARRAYDPLPCYPCAAGEVRTGWPGLARELGAEVRVLAVDGPGVLDWSAMARSIAHELRGNGVGVDLLDLRDHFASWELIVKRTEPVDILRDDPDFATLADGSLDDLFDELPVPTRQDGRVCVVYGPGAALVEHDVLWYADLPKRYAEAAITAGEARNLGQPDGSGPATTRRLFYIDWPLLDRHRDALADRIDHWLDLQRLDEPAWLSGAALRATLRSLADRPFRTRPTFNTTSWGGHWAQRELGFNPDARNTALGYELIAPESGVLIGDRDSALVEVPFQLLVAQQSERIMGAAVQRRFGTSFPIRFDYLDTVGGGSLSVHCHPREDRMRDVFGWPYTQHETYYVMVGGTDNVIYLGLRDDASIEEFHARAHDADEHAVPFDIERFVQTFPAQPHQLFLVPGGTPHGSGVGNVVLEVSATPYLYSLRFYDWLRRDADGKQRPVHVEHAFHNLNRNRRGADVRRELVQEPRTVGAGAGWRDEVIGALPEMFFEVRRFLIEPGAIVEQQTADRFHVLNVVDGEGALLRWGDADHPVAYAETIVVPAAVGGYRIEPVGDKPVRLVRAFVR